MSKIEVDAVEPQSGTDLTIGASGDTITVPAGATFDSSAATNTLPATVVTTTGTQTLTNKTINASQLIDDSVTTAKLAYNPNPFRNIIINGDFSQAQRATSVTGITGSGYYTVDRFQIGSAGSSGGTFTMSQDTDVPTGQGFATSLKMDCTTADASLGSSDALRISQFIEGQNLQYLKKGTANAESTTLSFWVKSNKTGTYISELRDMDNARAISKSYTIDVADTWEKKTLTFAGDTSGAFDNDNSTSLRLANWLYAGTDYTSGTLQTSWGTLTATDRAVGQVNIADSTSNEFYITGVQLEAGTSASDFEFLPVDVNKRRCQRYYQQIVQNSYFAGARANGTSAILGIKLFTVTPLRAAPTIDAGTYQYYYGDAGNGAISSSVTATSVVTDDTGVTSRANSGFTGLQDNEPVIPAANSTIGYDSEL